MRFAAVALTLVALPLAACGRSSGAADAGDAGACALEETGSFVFHVHNAGASPIVLDLGCGRTVPIVLATPAGRLAAGPGGVDVCEFTCDQVFSGRNAPGACTDCGGNTGQTLPPGASADVAWDRRVYAQRPAGPPCSQGTGTCAFGFAVAPAAAQAGVLTTCPADKHPTATCQAPTTTAFTVDTTGASATIDVP